ncbi:MAG: hypothetical protein Q9170_005873 [Blastenia crenularia]
MSDPLSSLASVFTLLGSTTQSTKALIAFFRDFQHAPSEVHEWLVMLESLHSALHTLEQYGSSVDSEQRFSLHLRERLAGCSNQLQCCATEVAKIDAEINKSKSKDKKGRNRGARRSWERTKWAMFGDQKMKRIMSKIQFYHFEVGMELLKILITSGRAVPPPANTQVSPEAKTPQQRRLERSEETSEPSSQNILGSIESLELRLPNQGGCHLATSAWPKPLPAAAHNIWTNLKTSSPMSVDWSREIMKRTMSLRYNMSAFRVVIQVGSVMKLRSPDMQMYRREKYQQTGHSFFLSIYLPKSLLFGLELRMWSFQLTLRNEANNPLTWNLNFPRVVPADAEIFTSARSGSTENVKRLLGLQRASARDTTEFGISLLHSASNSRNLELVRLLIREGADVNAQDEDGDSPLHSAMMRPDNYDVARTLIENGADVSNRAVDGKTPLHTFFNTTVSHVLMRDDWIEKLPPDRENMSIAHILAWSSRSSAILFKRGLLYDDRSAIATDNLGRTCLHFAASRGNVDILLHLLSQFPQELIEKRDNQGRTPILYAAESSRATQVIQLLATKGCDINVVDFAGRNALDWAARCDNVDAVKKLTTMVSKELLGLTNVGAWRPSQKPGQPKASDVYQSLKDLERSKDLEKEVANTTRIRRRRKSSASIAAFPLILEILGVLALIFLLPLGIPD